MQGCRNRGENREGEEEEERKRRCRKKRGVTLVPTDSGKAGGRRRSIMGERERESESEMASRRKRERMDRYWQNSRLTENVLARLRGRGRWKRGLFTSAIKILLLSLSPSLFSSSAKFPLRDHCLSLLTEGQTDGARGGYSATLGKYQNGETGRQTELERAVGGKRAEERKKDFIGIGLSAGVSDWHLWPSGYGRRGQSPSVRAECRYLASPPQEGRHLFRAELSLLPSLLSLR